MLDLAAAKAALRARLTATVFATTGVMTLAATTTGYSRASGSFIDDGFRIGMDVTPVGFADNTVAVVTDVSALGLTVDTPRAAEAAASGRSLGVTLPRIRAFDGAPLDSWPPSQSAIREEFIHTARATTSMAANSGNGFDRGLYVVHLFMPKEFGDAALDAMTTLLLARFASGTLLDAATDTLSMRWNPGPTAGQILPADIAGFCYRTHTIAWQAQSRTAVLP